MDADAGVEVDSDYDHGTIHTGRRASVYGMLKLNE